MTSHNVLHQLIKLTSRADVLADLRWGLKGRCCPYFDTNQDEQGDEKCQIDGFLPVVYTNAKDLSSYEVLGCVRVRFLRIHLGLVITMLITYRRSAVH